MRARSECSEGGLLGPLVAITWEDAGTHRLNRHGRPSVRQMSAHFTEKSEGQKKYLTSDHIIGEGYQDLRVTGNRGRGPRSAGHGK